MELAPERLPQRQAHDGVQDVHREQRAVAQLEFEVQWRKRADRRVASLETSDRKERDARGLHEGTDRKDVGVFDAEILLDGERRPAKGLPMSAAEVNASSVYRPCGSRLLGSYFVTRQTCNQTSTSQAGLKSTGSSPDERRKETTLSRSANSARSSRVYADSSY